MKKIRIIYILVILSTNVVISQNNASIIGIVKEKSNDSDIPIYSVSVTLLGMDRSIKKGTITDMKGRYKMIAPYGKYILQFSFIGYKAIEDTITLSDTKDIVLDKYLEEDDNKLSGIMVISKIDKSNKKTSLLIQKKATNIFQSVSEEELSMKGISNAEDGVNTVSGISKFRSRGTFVRGLGDRYNNVFLNGMPVPSINPDMKTISLDIFPSIIIRNIEVSKTYSASHYGDVTGATINIFTKEIDDKFFKINLGSKINSLMPMYPLKMSDNSLSQYFGFFGNSYDIPVAVSSNNNFEATPSESLSMLPKGYDFKYMPFLPVNIKLEASYQYEISFESNIGFITSLSFKNKYSKTNGKKRVLNASADPLYSYEFEQWEYNSNLTFMLNAVYNINLRNKIFLNNLYFHKTSAKTFEGFGFNNDFGLDDFFTRRITNDDKHLFIVQLLTNHNVIENILDINFGSTLSKVIAKKPKRSQLSSIGKGKESELFTLNASNNHIYWDNLGDFDKSLKLDISYKGSKYFNAIFGYQVRFVDRDFFWRQLNLIKKDESKLDGNLDTDISQSYINGQMLKNKLYYKDQADPSRNFSFNRNINAFFSSFDFNISEKLNLLFDIRVEISKALVKYKKMSDSFDAPFRESNSNYTNWIAAISTKYGFSRKANFKSSISKTITRPKVREILPNQYQEYISGAITQGNPDLTNSQSYNIDLKYEYFPTSSQIISLSLFGKYLNNPIEKVNIPESGIIYTFRNVKNASVYGAELEIDFELKNYFENKFLKNLGIDVDFMFQMSNVNLSEEDEKFLTNSSRPLQGASPYIINTNLYYDFNPINDWDSRLTVSHYFFGKRIYSIGSEGADDVYEKPYSTLNVLLKNKISNKLNISFDISNILDPLVVLKQGERSKKNTIIDMYNKGIDFSFSISYVF